MPAHLALRSGGFLRFSSSVNVVWDGNSLVFGVGSSGGQKLPTQVAALAPMAGSGAAVFNAGVSGQTWANMISGASDVDGQWSAGKTNVLVLWETTNAVCNTSKTSAQVQSEIATYIAARRAAHPWVIVGLTTIPREAAGTITDQTTRTAQNLVMADVDSAMIAGAMDFDRIVNVRQAGGPFNFAGYETIDFDSSGAVWNESSGGRIHLNNAGYAVVAGYTADVLRTLPRITH